MNRNDSQPSDQPSNQDIVDLHSEPRPSRWPYLIIAFPMLAGLTLAAYAYVTTDSHRLSYCVQATDASAYDRLPADSSGIIFHASSMLDRCKELDRTYDQGDGRTSGSVRWINCTGTLCGKEWQNIFARR
ncbi:MAG: hypothetical protein RQ867_05555 [Mariprofundaceae bacterium]|nr:hypothetical protein [Mariprofundaceae bacterium]